MTWDIAQLENFFGCKFSNDEQPIARFQAGGLCYVVWLMNQPPSFANQTPVFVINADVTNPEVGFPDVEIQVPCNCISRTEAIGIGPVLLIHFNDEVRLVVTKIENGRFSLSPGWRR